MFLQGISQNSADTFLECVIVIFSVIVQMNSTYESRPRLARQLLEVVFVPASVVLSPKLSDVNGFNVFCLLNFVGAVPQFISPLFQATSGWLRRCPVRRVIDLSD